MNDVQYWQLISIILAFTLFLSMIFFRSDVEKATHNLKEVYCYEKLFNWSLDDSVP